MAVVKNEWVPVKEGKSLTSKQLGKLYQGASVTVLEKSGERIKYKKTSGDGPESGWISAKSVEEDPSKASYEGKSVLAAAEAQVMKEGAQKVLDDASAKGASDSIAAAVAQLALGNLDKALEAAAGAQGKQGADKDVQGSALLVMAATKLARSEPAEAQGHADEALKIFKGLGDKQMEASALATLANARIVLKDSSAALTAAKDALGLFRDLGDKEGEAAALETLKDAYGLSQPGMAQQLISDDALAYHQGRGDSKRQAEVLQAMANAEKDPQIALARAKEAVALFRSLGDSREEGCTLLMMANKNLKMDSEGLAALMAADRAKSIFLLLGDKKYQSLASHAAAQGHMLIGDYDFGIQSAMQAAVLARDVGDKWGEATALHTATNGVLAKGRYGEALRMAKDVQGLFKALGSQDMEENSKRMVDKIQEAMPSCTPVPRMYIQPMDDARLAGQRSLFQENPNCVVWTTPCSSHTYLYYCMELLKLVDDMKNQSTKTAILVTSQGSFGRQVGEPIPSQMEGTYAMSVWAVIRTIRLESPRLHIAAVDVPPAATPYEITEVIRAAQIESGTRNEIAFFVDRKQQLGRGLK